MSDGELTGTGVEIDLTVTLKVDRSPGFPTGGVVVENEDWIYTAGMGATWEDALKIAWTEMVGLIADLYDTTVEYANLIVGTIGDAIPGYSAGAMNSRGFPAGQSGGQSAQWIRNVPDRDTQVAAAHRQALRAVDPGLRGA